LRRLRRTFHALRHIVGLSPGEIADRLGKTEASIHGLHHRGRAALQDALRTLESAPVIAHTSERQNRVHNSEQQRRA
jgi:DNA-directed RNA polymerase specialized sigma24 family protein